MDPSLSKQGYGRLRSRTAAVLAMDAAGYSRAMSMDEHRALAALAYSRRIIDPAIHHRGGRIFSTGGDSVLAEFASCDAAVRCSVDIQKALADAPRSGAEVLAYRIGIHLGRVFPTGDDLLGETVNIAARLESLSNPGGLCVSHQVLAKLTTADQLNVETMGLQTLKGIKDSIGVARIRLGEPSGNSGPGARVSVMVMPFRSAQDDAFWSEGLADELTAALSRFSTLSVHARPPRLLSGTRNLNLTAADVGPDYIVDGVLRVQLPRFRLSIQVIERATGIIVWSEKISDQSADLLDLQDRLTDLIVGRLPGQLSQASTAIAFRKSTESLGARELYYRGLRYADRLDIQSSRSALASFESAIAKDHQYAPALAMSALVQLRLWALDGSKGDLGSVAATAERAVHLDPGDSWSHLVLGQITMYRQLLDEAEIHHKKAFALNPFDARIFALRSPLAAYLGKPDEGREWIRRAIDINPHHPPWYLTNLGLCHYCAGQYADGEFVYNNVPQPQTGVLAGLVACRAQMDDRAGARSAAEKLLAVQPDFSTEVYIEMRPFRFAHDRDHLRDGLRRGGLPR